MEKQRIRISDVAEVAGVSIATVSHVVNQTRFVSDATTKKVEQAIAELGYMPSSIARGLAGKGTKTIGVIFSDISNPFFTSLYMGLESVFTTEGYELILANTGEVDAHQEATLRIMHSRQIDGLIIAPTGRESPMLDMLSKSGIPVVLIDRTAPGENYSLVDIDNISIAHKATLHLIEDGYEQIGIILGLPDVSTTSLRLQGYRQALSQFDLPFLSEYVVDGYSKIAGGYQGTKKLLSLPHPPQAFLTLNNLMTSGALQAFRELGVTCPENIGLLGFDDHDWGDIITPPLSVVRQPTFNMGVEAAQILINNLNGAPPVHRQLSGQLVIRGSCSPGCWQRYAEKSVELSSVFN